MASADYRMNIAWGSVEFGRALGVWRQDDDGGWWEEHAPTRWLDRNGNVEREEPYTPALKIYGIAPRYLPGRALPNPMVASPKRPWWRFWP